MRLIEALNLRAPSSVAFVGAGGKTSALFRAAHEICTAGYTGTGSERRHEPVLVSTTTHFEVDQTNLADQQIRVRSQDEIEERLEDLSGGVIAVTGEECGDRRVAGLDEESIRKLSTLARNKNLPLIIEADGARRRPVKAPAEHEPAIPEWVDHVVVVVGMGAVGKPTTENHVHRMERFTAVTGLRAGSIITTDVLVKLLLHPNGGLKNIPVGTRRTVLINQADTVESQAGAMRMAERLVGVFDSVVITALQKGAASGGQGGARLEQILGGEVYAAHRPVAGIVLAAGESARFGQPKQLLEWRGEPLVRRVSRISLAAGLSEVVVVTGSSRASVRQVLSGMPVKLVENLNWAEGQASSVRAGIRALQPRTGGAIFLLADQPLVTTNLIKSLREEHARSLAPIIAPMVDGRRGNPVLFDRTTFADLASLEGEAGGRTLFSKFRVHELPWHDQGVLFVVDTLEDYQQLLRREPGG
jgi:molybdenum cofactor cytidylyltransferase